VNEYQESVSDENKTEKTRLEEKEEAEVLNETKCESSFRSDVSPEQKSLEWSNGSCDRAASNVICIFNSSCSRLLSWLSERVDFLERFLLRAFARPNDITLSRNRNFFP
jgi:hypothetical protein